MITREGSAKSILIEKMPQGDEPGVGYFVPKDSFSIFDYKTKGKWPFEIPYKGMAMTYIVNQSFEIARDAGIRTCFLEAIDDGCKIKIVRVPGTDGFPLEAEKTEVGTRNRVVDLEIIFNYCLHPRSSLLRDFMAGRKDFREYGFAEMPKGGEVIPNAARNEFKLLFTTKYDKRGDIALTEQEARTRSRLTEKQWEEGMGLIKKCIPLISAHAEQKKLLRADGKYELFVDGDGSVGLADTFGNPEEDRYIMEIKDFPSVERFFDFYMRRWHLEPAKTSELVKETKTQGRWYQDMSKQFLRNWYIDNGWKKLYEEGQAGVPPDMHHDALTAYSAAMLSFASAWSGKTGDIVNRSGELTRPLAEVTAELFVLEHLNRKGLVPK